MGCGISTMDANNASKIGRRYGRLRHQPAIVDINKKYNDDDDGDGDDQEAKRKNEVFNEKKTVVDRKDQEERVEFLERQGKLEQDNVSNGIQNVSTNYGEGENNNNNNYRDDFIGPGSPSFREYCTDYDSVDRNSMGDSNDYTESGESKNSSDEDSTKPGNENKEPEKKGRRGRGGFRNAMHKGKARGGRRNLLIACYNSSTQSHAEGSLNKIVAKTT